jgi:hypothetical protein
MRALPLLIPMAVVKQAAGTCVVTMLLAMSVAACGAVGAPFGGVRDRPENPKAIAPRLRPARTVAEAVGWLRRKGSVTPDLVLGSVAVKHLETS